MDERKDVPNVLISCTTRMEPDTEELSTGNTGVGVLSVFTALVFVGPTRAVSLELDLMQKPARARSRSRHLFLEGSEPML